METKNILIVGGGLVGQTLAGKLSKDGHDVTLVESNSKVVRELSETLDISVIEGNGSTEPVLRRAGIEQASLVVASTNSDECNVIVGLLAAELFRIPEVVVRIHDPDHEAGFRTLARGSEGRLVCVNPDMAAVDRIATLLEVPGAIDVVTFMDGELLVAGFRIGPSSDFAGMRVSDMKLLFASTPTLAVAIHRGVDWIVPGGAEEIKAGDLVYFGIARHELRDVLTLVGAPEDDRTRVTIGGATPIGLALARRLEARDVRVTLIEDDHALAQLAAEELAGTTVIRGGPTDQSLLEDEEIERSSTFVAVTGDHERNLVAGLLAKRLGVGRAFVLVDSPELVALVGDIGIDAIISPRSLTIGLTLQLIRGATVRSGAALLEDQVEIMEVEAEARSKLTSAPLRDLALPRGVLVAALRREGVLRVPHGDDRVEPGDRIILIATTGLAPRISEFLEG